MSRDRQGTKRCSISMPGMAAGTVRMKKSRQPMASTIAPAGGPAKVRPSAKMLEKSAYCVALKRRWVSRSSSTPKAPVPIPLVPASKKEAAYMTGRLTPASRMAT